jgi:hypothetical protein
MDRNELEALNAADIPTWRPSAGYELHGSEECACLSWDTRGNPHRVMWLDCTYSRVFVEEYSPEDDEM